MSEEGSEGWTEMGRHRCAMFCVYDVLRGRRSPALVDASSRARVNSAPCRSIANGANPAAPAACVEFKCSPVFIRRLMVSFIYGERR
jgi:hypothetical protein